MIGDDINTSIPLPELRTILLEDVKIAAGGLIPDEVINDMMIEVIRDTMRSTARMYIMGVFRAEILESTEKIVFVESPYFPSTVWDCLKYYINEKLHTKFKVSLETVTATAKVTFERKAIYPHMPSLKAEYGRGRAVIKEAIRTEYFKESM
jgi:hypothetical protein